MAKVLNIYICPAKGDPMVRMSAVLAIKGQGLEGDRYAYGKGSWNQNKPGHRQVTLINIHSINDSVFNPQETRRNIVTKGIELMILIGKEFLVGSILFKGVKYCTPCDRPSNLSGLEGFKDAYTERGGLIAEVLADGVIYEGDEIAISEPKPKHP
jgi:hypothetical protein